MMPHIHQLRNTERNFWRGMSRTMLSILAGAVALVGLGVWWLI